MHSRALERDFRRDRARIKAAKPQTLKGAVARAALFVGDEDWEMRLLADLREIVAREARS